MPTTWLTLLLAGAGIFTVVLGVLHFFLPAALDYRSVVLERAAGAKPPRPFRIRPTHYVVSLRDRLGIIWIMNHAASYTLVSIGLVDLVGAAWLQSGPGRLLALWIAGWWLLRAASQFSMGRRAGDWVILAFFASLGVLHLIVWLR